MTTRSSQKRPSRVSRRSKHVKVEELDNATGETLGELTLPASIELAEGTDPRLLSLVRKKKVPITKTTETKATRCTKCGRNFSRVTQLQKHETTECPAVFPTKYVACAFCRATCRIGPGVGIHLGRCPKREQMLQLARSERIELAVEQFDVHPRALLHSLHLHLTLPEHEVERRRQIGWGALLAAWLGHHLKLHPRRTDTARYAFAPPDDTHIPVSDISRAVIPSMEQHIFPCTCSTCNPSIVLDLTRATSASAAPQATTPAAAGEKSNNMTRRMLQYQPHDALAHSCTCYCCANGIDLPADIQEASMQLRRRRAKVTWVNEVNARLPWSIVGGEKSPFVPMWLFQDSAAVLGQRLG